MPLIKWQKRLEEMPSLREFKHWPAIPVSQIPKDKYAEFIRNQKIVSNVLAGQAFNTVAQNSSLTKGRISQIMNRCLGGDDNDAPKLTYALVPNTRIKKNERRLDLPSIDNQKGYANAFQKLLDLNPTVRDTLEEILKASIGDKPYAQKTGPKNRHKTFLKLLAEVNWPTTQYPYCTEDLGYESLRQYCKERETQIRLEKGAKKSFDPPTSVHNNKIRRAMRATQIDAHHLDLRMKIVLDLNDELIPLPLSRVSVLAAIDVDSSCILGYWLASAKEVNTQDMMCLFQRLLNGQPPMYHTPNIDRLPGAFFPCEIEDHHPITFGMVQLDNALVNKSYAVREFLNRKMASSIHLGHPKHPEVRRLIESVFDYIEANGLHRFASTTGSYPTDPKKESRKNAKKVPVVTFQTVNEVIDLLLTTYNVTPQDALGGASPLELYQHHTQTKLTRFVHPMIRETMLPLVSQQRVKIHFPKTEKRRPYVNIFYNRYKGKALFESLKTESHVYVEYHLNDIRSLEVVTADGRRLGKVYAPESWQRYAYSPATRAKIHKQTKHQRFRMTDPLSAYFLGLLDDKGKISVATQILKIYTEYTHGYDVQLNLGELPTTKEAPVDNSTDSETWEWTPGKVNSPPGDPHDNQLHTPNFRHPES